MQLTITGRHLEVTEPLKARAEEKTSKLPRYFDSIRSVDVVFSKENDGFTAEIIVKADQTYVATESGDDVYNCFDLVLHKIERQLLKAKGKQRNPMHNAEPTA